jgi:hypothetical protein
MQQTCLSVYVCPLTHVSVTLRERCAFMQNEDWPVFSPSYKTAKYTANKINAQWSKLHSCEQSKFQLCVCTENLITASRRAFYVGFAQREGV